MTLAQIIVLHFQGKNEAAKKRVQKLKSAGYVRERPRRTYEPSILFLTPEGFRLLSQRGHLADYPRIGVETMERRAQVSDLTLRHELEVMDVKVAIVAAVQSAPGGNERWSTRWTRWAGG